MPNWDDFEDFFTKESNISGGFETGAAAAAGAYIINDIINKAPESWEATKTLFKKRVNRFCQTPGCIAKAPKNMRFKVDPQSGNRLCPNCARKKTSANIHHDSFDAASAAVTSALNAHDGSAASHKRIADALANKARLTKNAKAKAELWNGVEFHNEQHRIKSNSEKKQSIFDGMFSGPYAIACKECGHVDSAQYMRDGKCSDGVGCS